MMLIDSNIFMYAAGVDHPNKKSSIHVLQQVVGGALEGCTSVEILQEILHRYRSIDRWHDGKQVFETAKIISKVIYPIDLEILDQAKQLLDKYPSIMARDAVHAATVLVLGLEGICSHDRDFDALIEVHRLEPGNMM
ncbi:MAG: type II toxin-antitoxin system VapC family toxin [Desulfobacterales bacterium]